MTTTRLTRSPPREEHRIEEIDLGDDFRQRQVADGPVQATGAKGAVHVAAGLTRHTDAVPIIVVHQDRLNRIAVRQAQQ